MDLAFSSRFSDDPPHCSCRQGWSTATVCHAILLSNSRMCHMPSYGPYVPYWFEAFSQCIPWIVPILALAGLWIARLCEDSRVRSIAEACYFGAMVVAAMFTLRTILADDNCWLLHTSSLGLMILGAIFPHHMLESTAQESLGENSLSDAQIR